MQTHVIKNSLIAVALALVCQLAFAQDDPTAAPAPKAKAKPAAAAPAAPASNATEIDSSTSTALDYLFNHKAGEGTTMKAGNTVASALADKIKAVDVLKTPGLDDPALRARFETYLSLKEVSQDRINEYFTKMVSVTKTLKTNDTFGAWKILYSLSDYQDLNAGISRELAAKVESFWNTDRTKNGLEIANNQLRDNIRTYNHNADLEAQDLAEQNALSPQKSAGKNSSQSNSNSSGVSNSNTTNSPLLNINSDPVAAEAALMPTMGSALMGKMEMTAEYLNLLEARAKIKLNEIRENKMSDLDREAFSDYIKTLYKSHRYYHVIIAADFYRALFNEGDYPSDLANQAVAAAGSNAKSAADSAHLAIKSIGLNASGPASALNNLGAAAGRGPNTRRSAPDHRRRSDFRAGNQ